jgi:hypothetical protein
MIQNRIRGWKESLAFCVGAGAVAWHIMACVESPMSFSPSGDLAFAVVDPYPRRDSDWKHFGLTGGAVSRLMVLTKDKKLTEIERTNSQMLTAPAFSPDGREFAFLRLPLLTQEDKDRIDEFIKKRAKVLEQALDQATSGSTAEKWIFVAPEGATPAFPHDDKGDVLTNWTDLTLPPPADLMSVLSLASGGGLVPAELVVRSASTGALVRSIPLNIPQVQSDVPSDVEGINRFSYLLTRPQYSPDGAWLYFSLGGLSLAVSPSTGDKRLLASGSGPVLSPDGKTLAILSREVLSLRSTDGERAVFVRFQHAPSSWGGIAWTGNNTVAVLGADIVEDPVKPVVDIYDTDGHLLRSTALPGGSTDRKSGELAELAVSPNGEYMAISYGKLVQFLASDGKALGSWEAKTDGEALVQPTFTPDSRQIAFKLMQSEKTDGEEWLGTVAIVFFTPEGQEIFRVPIPRAPLDQAPEPSQPATEGPQQ